ncbi:MAG: cytidylyltransferase domain-containing protein [Gammaproteobacteria bacterium]
MIPINKDFGIVIQSRLGSNRLPLKALLYFGGSTVIGYLIKSLIDAGVKKDYICVATSSSELDNLLTDYIESIDIKVIRGDEDNVLKRYQTVADETGFKNIVRLTGDNPLIDIDLISLCIKRHLKGNFALTTTRNIKNNLIKRYAPKGLSVDVLSSDALLSIDTDKCNNFEKEHVIPFFFSNFSVQIVKDYSSNRADMSIDTIDDYKRLFKL